MRMLARNLCRLRVINFVPVKPSERRSDVFEQWKYHVQKEFLGNVTDRGSSGATTEEYGLKDDYDKVILTTSDLLGDVYKNNGILERENNFIKILDNMETFRIPGDDAYPERKYVYKVVKVCHSHGIVKIFVKRVLWKSRSMPVSQEELDSYGEP